MIRRTRDPVHLNRVLNDPAVRPHVGGGVAPLDAGPVLADLRNFAFETPNGGFIFMAASLGDYEVHSFFTPAGRGREALVAAVAALAFMFTRTDCLDVLTKVPESNKGAHGLARALGFDERFVRAKAWPIAGGPDSVSHRGLTIQNWAMRSKACAAAGEAFHELLEAHKAAIGSPLPTHDEDPAHHAAVGAAVLMAQGGVAEKGVAFYNRWARFAGYQAATLLSRTPVVIDAIDAVFSITPDNLEVL